MGRERGQASSLGAALGAHILVGVVGYLTVIFFLSAVVFPDWEPFAAEGFPAHAAYGPLVVSLLALTLPRLKDMLGPEGTATVTARRLPGVEDRVVMELHFWSGEGSYREEVKLAEYRMALETLTRIGALGYGVQRVHVEDELAATVESRPDAEVLEHLMHRVLLAPAAGDASQPQTFPERQRELEFTS